MRKKRNEIHITKMKLSKNYGFIFKTFQRSKTSWDAKEMQYEQQRAR